MSWLIIVLVLVVPPLSALAQCPSHELRVQRDDGQRLVRLPMPEGAGWCLAWNHSVAGFAVHDCYRNVAGRMVLERSHLPDFAAGLDHIPGRGRQVSDGAGGYWIEAIDEPVPGDRYRLRVGAARVDHRLVGHGQPSLAVLLAEARDCGTADRYPMAEDAPVVVSLSALAAHQRVTLALEPADSPP